MIRSCRLEPYAYSIREKKQVSVQCLLRRQSHTVTVLLSLNGLSHIRQQFLFYNQHEETFLTVFQCFKCSQDVEVWVVGNATASTSSAISLHTVVLHSLSNIY